MSLNALAETLERFRLGYLVTVTDDGGAHIVAVHVTVDGASLLVSEPGPRTRANAGARPTITMFWPPADPDGYSLIVDGRATPRGEHLAVAPTRAVLHRAAPPQQFTDHDASCASDCVEVPLATRTGP